MTVGAGKSHSMNFTVKSVSSMFSMSMHRLRQTETHFAHRPHPVQVAAFEPSPSQERGLQPT